MNYSVFTVNKKIGAKRAKFDSKRSQKLKTASKQEINRKNFHSQRKSTEPSSKGSEPSREVTKTENLKHKEEN